jgi:foldase protein PrsA
LIKTVAAVVALLAIVIVVFGVLVYVYKSDSPVVKTMAKIVPYPVERVNGHFVSYSDYLFEVDANKRAYQNNAKLNNQPAVNFNSADGKKLVTQIKQHSLQKLEGDAVVAQLAGQKKVKVTDKEVNDLINQLYTRYGGRDTLLKTLKDIYGWDLNDLKKVVRKQLLAKNLEDKVTSDPAMDAAAKAKAQDVLKQVKAGGDFTELAKKNSQASDAASGGDLGFFTKGQLPDNLQAAAEALQPGQVSDVMKTQYGYEILKVIEKKDDGSIHAQHILTKTVDFNEYFQAELSKAKVNNYIKV